MYIYIYIPESIAAATTPQKRALLSSRSIYYKIKIPGSNNKGIKKKVCSRLGSNPARLPRAGT